MLCACVGGVGRVGVGVSPATVQQGAKAKISQVLREKGPTWRGAQVKQGI